MVCSTLRQLSGPQQALSLFQAEPCRIRSAGNVQTGPRLSQISATAAPLLIDRSHYYHELPVFGLAQHRCRAFLQAHEIGRERFRGTQYPGFAALPRGKSDRILHDFAPDVRKGVMDYKKHGASRDPGFPD